MSYSFGQMPSMATNLFSAYASVAASMMLFRSVANEVIPQPLKTFLYTSFEHFFKHVFGRFFRKLSTQMTMVIDEQSGITRNQIYDAAEIYLRSKINPNTERLKANKTPKQNSITLSMEKGEEVIDSFKDFQLTWVFVLVEPDGDSKRYQSTKRYFELKFEKLHRETVVNDYLPFVLAKAKEMKDNERAVKLYTRDCPYDDDDDDDGGNRGGIWGCVNLDHPVTFDKLAMDPNLKKFIIEDLDRFVRRKEYYKTVGKAWKRGYLLYGPPGTGKSSLIAAMANYLKFDVYDLELTSIYNNSDLRRTLLCTNNRSIIVIEDIDCNSQTLNREDDSDRSYEDSSKLTLSGLLNFIDGLWSTCGDERIIIFTTNHKDKLDPALLRPGRMDMHIHMGYCTPEGFDVLLNNYLGINDHPRLCLLIKELIKEVDVSPAEIAEHLMRSEDVDLALEGVLGLLKQKKVEKNIGLDAASNDKEKETEAVQSDETDGKNSFGKIVGNLAKFRWQTKKSKKKGR